MNVPALAQSAADVLRYLLVQRGVGIFPNNTATDWQVYESNEPDGLDPLRNSDQVITTYDTTGVDDGRMMPTGERMEQYGVQVRIRGATKPSAWGKAEEIRIQMDEGIHDESVTIAGVTYTVHSLSRKGGLMFLGNDTPQTKRKLYTVNATMTITRTN